MAAINCTLRVGSEPRSLVCDQAVSALGKLTGRLKPSSSHQFPSLPAQFLKRIAYTFGVALRFLSSLMPGLGSGSTLTERDRARPGRGGSLVPRSHRFSLGE